MHCPVGAQLPFPKQQKGKSNSPESSHPPRPFEFFLLRLRSAPEAQVHQSPPFLPIAQLGSFLSPAFSQDWRIIASRFVTPGRNTIPTFSHHSYCSDLYHHNISTCRLLPSCRFSLPPGHVKLQLCYLSLSHWHSADDDLGAFGQCLCVCIVYP